MHQNFTVPDDDEIISAFGIDPESLPGDDEITKILRIALTEQEEVVFSYSILGRSVRFEWRQDDQLRARIFREGATLVSIESSRGKTGLRVEFEIEGVKGVLRLQIFPVVTFDDKLLLT